MYIKTLSLLSLFGASVLAVPGSDIFKRAACNADNCYRAAVASSAKPYASSAAKDCSSFQRTTVTPCPVTSTIVATVTTTAPVVTVSVSASTVVASTVDSTATVTTTITNGQTLTVTTPTTTTVSTTTTVTANQKRDVEAKRSADVLALPTLSGSLGHLDRRAVTPACSPSSTSATAVPTYASACSGTVRYASACSCAGVPATMVTIPAVTASTTVTTTVTVTPTISVTSTSTSTAITTVVVATTTLSVTVTPITATVTVPTTVTVTSVATATAQCSAYNFVATSGTYAGQYLQGDRPDPNSISYGFESFTSSASSASVYTVRADGTVYDQNTYGWVTDSDTIYYILQMTDRSFGVYGSSVEYVHCTIGSGDTSYPGAVGTVSCTDAQGAEALVACDSTSNDLLKSQQGATDGTCSNVNLVAIKAC